MYSTSCRSAAGVQGQQERADGHDRAVVGLTDSIQIRRVESLQAALNATPRQLAIGRQHVISVRAAILARFGDDPIRLSREFRFQRLQRLAKNDL